MNYVLFSQRSVSKPTTIFKLHKCQPSLCVFFVDFHRRPIVFHIVNCCNMDETTHSAAKPDLELAILGLRRKRAPENNSKLN